MEGSCGAGVDLHKQIEDVKIAVETARKSYRAIKNIQTMNEV
jgi:hypothetical protein